jgi:hypothetical protein
MKSLLVILSICLNFNYSIVMGQSSIDFGEGEITINMYSFSPKDSSNEGVSILSKENLHQSFNYTIHHNDVFRHNSNNNYKNVKSKDSSREIDLQIFSPNYLIRYDSSVLYYFSYDNGKLEKILQYELRGFTYEYFFHERAPENMLPLPSYDTSQTFLINGIPCFRGNEFEKKSGYPVSFYFTTAKMAIRSPLNGYFGFTSFPFNIVRIKFLTEWSENNMVFPGKGQLIFELDKNIKPLLDTSDFILPKTVPLFKNTPIEVELQSTYEKMYKKAILPTQ